MPYTRETLVEYYLSVSADLSQSSIEYAIKILGKDYGLYIACPQSQLSEELRQWLWDNHRGISFFIVPAGMLRHPETWALIDTFNRKAVISRGG